MKEPSDDDLLTAEEAAPLLRVEPDTLYRWRLNGNGPRFYKGEGKRGRVGYLRSDILAYREKRMRQSTSQEDVHA